MAEATLHPNKSTIEHYHEKSEEIYYILGGGGKIKVGEEIENVKEGDAVLISAETFHKIWNEGEEDLIFLCCCSPGYLDEDTKLVK